MRGTLPFALALLLLSCSGNRTPSVNVELLPDSVLHRTAASTKETKTYAQLLQKFKALSFDTLEVFPPLNLQDTSFRYWGVPLDEPEVDLLPDEAGDFDAGLQPSHFAVYQFPMDSATTGLIVRTPSHQVSTSIMLLAYNKKDDAITASTQLCDKKVNGGFSYLKKAWLIKTPQQKLQSLVWTTSTTDHSVANKADSTIEKHNSYYLLNILSYYMRDTTARDSATLVKNYKRLLK